MAGRNDFEERKQTRIDRYEEKSSITAAQSNIARSTAFDIVGNIPMGQPILVGHHSEKRHRRDLERADNNMRKSIELSEKSDYYQNKAESARCNKSIFSDDPLAIDKLKEKLLKMEEQHKDNLEMNRYFKKHGTMKDFKDIAEEEALKLDIEINDCWAKMPAPAYVLSNETAEIRRIKKRIEKFEKLEKLEVREKAFHGVKIKESDEENRVQIFFDEKPPEEVRKKLHGRGFKWSRTNLAWQRLRTEQAYNIAIYIIAEHYEEI